MQNFLLLLCHFAFLLLPFDFPLGFPLCGGGVYPHRLFVIARSRAVARRSRSKLGAGFLAYARNKLRNLIVPPGLPRGACPERCEIASFHSQ